MLEARDEHHTGLPFWCLLTQIILQSGIIITGDAKMKIQQPISKQALMKSNAQLRREDSDDDMPAAMPVVFPDVASSSHTVPRSESEVNVSQIMEALAAIQGGMTTMQQSISSLQLEVRSINKRVEQTHSDLQERLQAHHPDSSDDEAAAPRVVRRAPRTASLAEDVWVSLCFYFACCFFLRLFVLFLWCFVKHLQLYYSVYPGPSETIRGSNFYYIWILFTLFYPLSLCDKKGE
jgi:hypothetical protein